MSVDFLCLWYQLNISRTGASQTTLADLMGQCTILQCVFQHALNFSLRAALKVFGMLLWTVHSIMVKTFLEAKSCGCPICHAMIFETSCGVCALHLKA